MSIASRPFFLLALLLSALAVLASAGSHGRLQKTSASVVLRRRDLQDEGTAESQPDDLEASGEEPEDGPEEEPEEEDTEDMESEEEETEDVESEEESSDEEDAEVTPKKRECKLNGKKDEEVVFKCKSKVEEGGTETEDEIKFEVKVDDMLTVEVEYSQEIEVETDEMETETESETEYEVSFVKLIEYVSASGGYEPYSWEDEILLDYPLDDFSEISEIVSSDDGVTSTFSATTNDGKVTFTFTISQAAMGETLDANKMKIDLNIVEFPWVGSDSSIALLAYIESKRKIERKEDDVAKTVEDIEINFAEAVDTVGFVPFGEFSWVKSATAASSEEGEPAEIEVVATSPSASSSSTSQEARIRIAVEDIAFSFIGAQGSNDIFWDPSAGVAYTATEEQEATGTSGANALSGFVVGAMVASASLVNFAL